MNAQDALHVRLKMRTMPISYQGTEELTETETIQQGIRGGASLTTVSRSLGCWPPSLEHQEKERESRQRRLHAYPPPLLVEEAALDDDVRDDAHAAVG